MSSFEILPIEVVELIFTSIPLTDLIRNCSLVSRRWRDIIRNPEFIPWKKAYYRYKILPNDAEDEREVTEGGEPPDKMIRGSGRDEVFGSWKHHKMFQDFTSKSFAFTNDWIKHETIIAPCQPENLHSSREMLLPALVHYASKTFGAQSKKFLQIKRHPKASWAKLWLEKTMPEISSVEVAQIVVICAIAEDTWDVQDVFKALLSPGDGTVCTRLDVSELLYFVALAFLRSCRILNLPIRFHYNVFQAIYLTEHSSSIGTEVHLTNEQSRITQYPLDPKSQEVIKIVGFAGSGKTTTLINLCTQHPNLKFLFVVYNKSVKDHAAKVFPSNVMCVTAHEMAMEKFGFLFSKTIFKNLIADNIVDDIVESGLLTDPLFDIDTTFAIEERTIQVLRTVENFINSADLDLNLSHVPVVWRVYEYLDDVPLHDEERDWIMENSRRIWEAMNDNHDKRLGMTPDGYLKGYQRRKPDLQEICQHDILLVDEAHVMNQATIDIFLHQKTPKFLVGDLYQQIYPINAFNSVPADHTFYLTQNFRFGPEIAFAVNVILSEQRCPEQKSLVAGRKRDFILLGSCEIDPKLEEFRPVAIIGQSVNKLLCEVDKLVCDADESNRPTAALVGGLESYDLDDYLDIYYLIKGENDKLKKWKTLLDVDFFQELNTEENKDIYAKISFVKRFGDRLPKLIENIRLFCNCDPQSADYVFSTAHKARDLEWQTVILLDDLGGFFPGTSHKLADDDRNIMYVAITRAKKYLVINNAILNAMGKFQYNFERVKFSEPDSVCVFCQKSTANDGNVLQLERPRVTLSGLLRSEGGRICSICSGKFYQKNMVEYHFGELLKDLTRETLRYFCGPLAHKMEEARTLLNNFEPNEMLLQFMNQMQQQQPQ